MHSSIISVYDITLIAIYTKILIICTFKYIAFNLISCAVSSVITFHPKWHAFPQIKTPHRIDFKHPTQHQLNYKTTAHYERTIEVDGQLFCLFILFEQHGLKIIN